MHLTWGNVIAMLTDFGTKDEFVGTMKGVIACIAPSVNVVDITHDVTPYAVAEAAFRLAASYRYFPRGSVFLAIVDPGVGTNRRAISLETTQYRFVAPDNGLLWFIIDSETVIECRELSNTRFHLGDKPSSTFHGRDIFAPVAAHLANGVPVSMLGRKLDPGTLIRLQTIPSSATEEAMTLRAVQVDRFGNIATSAGFEQFRAWAGPNRLFLAQALGTKTIQVKLVTTYGDVRHGEPCLIENSSGMLELAVNQGSAVDDLGLSAMNYRNTQITLRRLPQ